MQEWDADAMAAASATDTPDPAPTTMITAAWKANVGTGICPPPICRKVINAVLLVEGSLDL